MSDLKVNTTAVVNSAERIHRHNQGINEVLALIDQSSAAINMCWRSSSSNNSNLQYRSIVDTFYRKRYDAVEGLVGFLGGTVSTGFERVERRNISLADSFLE